MKQPSKPAKKKIAKPGLDPNLSKITLGKIADEIRIENSLLSNCNFAGQKAKGLIFDSVRVKNVKLTNSELHKLEATDAIFENCDLANADLSKAVFYRTEFLECRITGFKTIEATFRDVIFKGCKGEMAQFRMSGFKNVKGGGTSYGTRPSI